MDVILHAPYLDDFTFPTDCFGKVRDIAYGDLDSDDRTAAVEWLVDNCESYRNNPHFGTFREDFFAALQVVFENPGEFDIYELRMLHCYSSSNLSMIRFYNNNEGMEPYLFIEAKEAFSSQVLQFLRQKVSDHIRSAAQFAWFLRNQSLLSFGSATEWFNIDKIIDLFIAFYDELTPEEKCDSLQELQSCQQWCLNDVGENNDELIQILTRDFVKILELDYSDMPTMLVGQLCFYLSNDGIFAKACSYSPSIHDHAFRLSCKAAFGESDLNIITHILSLIDCFIEDDITGNRSAASWKFSTTSKCELAEGIDRRKSKAHAVF